MNDLFAELDPVKENEPVKTKAPDTLSIIARRKLNLPDVYTCCGWRRVDPDGLLVNIAEEYIKQSGKNKGKRGWRGKERTAFVTYAEEIAERVSWEKSTGKCSTCGGDGKEICGWSVESGQKYRECKRCNGSGQANEQPPIA